MKRLLFVLLLAAAPMFAESAAAPSGKPPLPSQVPAVCHLSAVSSSGLPVERWAACVLEDMGAPELGFNNRFRVLIALPSDSVEADSIADYIKVGCTPEGAIEIRSILWGSITVNPKDPQHSAAFRERAPAFEIRAQVLTVSASESGVQVLIEERFNDFDGKVPSDDWIARHLQSFQRLSHAK